MTYPASDVVTTNVDASTDSPATARSDLLDLATKFNLLRNHITSFMQTFLNRSTAALARADLGVAPRATRIDVASVAGTVDLTTNAPDSDDIQITGALAITAFTVAVGRVIRVRASGAHTLTNSGSIVTQTGANMVCVVGTTYTLRATAANVVEVLDFISPKVFSFANAYGSNSVGTSMVVVNRTGGETTGQGSATDGNGAFTAPGVGWVKTTALISCSQLSGTVTAVEMRVKKQSTFELPDYPVGVGEESVITSFLPCVAGDVFALGAKASGTTPTAIVNAVGVSFEFIPTK